MTVKKQELWNMVETLPDELSDQVLDYIEYLKYTFVLKNAPQNVKAKDKNDLRKKLEEGINNTEKGNVCSIEKAFLEVEEILAE
jgi:hypothetical protein